MKKIELGSVRKQTAEQILKLVEEKKSQLLAKRSELANGKEKNLKAVKNIMKDVSRLLTVLREKEIIEDKKTVK